MKSTNNSIILVTGSDGFVGSHLVEELVKTSKVIGVSVGKSKKSQNFKHLTKDILTIKASDFGVSLSGIIHLAAVTDVQFCEKNPYKCFMINTIGTQNALEVARKKDCKFVYLSTSQVYGKPNKIPIKEDHPTRPLSIYAASKLCGEICCEGYAKTYGMDVAIVRLFSVYGPRSPPHLVTSRIISQLEKKSIYLGNLNAKRDFIFISDAISAINLVFRRSRGLNVFNVGSGKSYSILEICNILKKISGKDIPVNSKKQYLRKVDVKQIVSNSFKIKKLGWRPQVSINSGLKRTLDYYWSRKNLN